MTAYVHTQVLLRQAGGLFGAVVGDKESDQPGEQSSARRQLPRGCFSGRGGNNHTG